MTLLSSLLGQCALFNERSLYFVFMALLMAAFRVHDKSVAPLTLGALTPGVSTFRELVQHYWDLAVGVVLLCMYYAHFVGDHLGEEGVEEANNLPGKKDVSDAAPAQKP